MNEIFEEENIRTTKTVLQICITISPTIKSSLSLVDFNMNLFSELSEFVFYLK